LDDAHLDLVSQATLKSLELNQKLVILLHSRPLINSVELVEHKDRPVSIWRIYQSLLSRIYSQIARDLHRAGNPLLEATVIPVDICGYSVNEMEIERIYYWEETGKVELLEMLGGRDVDVVALRSSVNWVSDIHVDPIECIDKVYNHVALGGTFDHLHFGHKILLSIACLIANQRLVCGVMGDSHK
jgi:hypothetical protein